MKNKAISATLFLSLLLNVFLIGFIIAKPNMMLPPQMAFARMKMAEKVLSPDSREKVQAIWEESKPQLKQDMKTMVNMFTKGRAIVTDPSLKPEDFETLHQEMMAQDNMVKEHFFKTMMKIAEILPPEERARYFDALMPKKPPFMPKELKK